MTKGIQRYLAEQSYYMRAENTTNLDEEDKECIY